MPPFSGKQKKKQLQEKRERKKQREKWGEEGGTAVHIGRGGWNRSESRHDDDDDARKNHHVAEEYKYGADRRGIRSVFLKETAEEVAARKKLSYEPLTQRRFMSDNGVPFGSWFDMPGHPNGVLIPLAVEMPTRGWIPEEAMSKRKDVDSNERSTSRSMGSKIDDDDDDASPEKVALEAREAVRFQAYLDVVDNYHLPSTLPSSLQVSLYERNIDVWRQLWRTVEQSDVVVVVSDARYPILHLPLSLMHYVVRQCKKPCLVVLNKADLTPPQVLHKWLTFLPLYFKAAGIVETSEAEAEEAGIVREIPLMTFTSLPEEETAIGSGEACNAAQRRKKKTRRTKLYEQLRTGKVQVAVVPKKSNDDEHSDDDDDEEEEEEAEENSGVNDTMVLQPVIGVAQNDAYAKTDNFKGMQKAERELQQGRRDHKELQIVSDMISSLLRQCRAMCKHKYDNVEKVKGKNAGNGTEKGEREADEEKEEEDHEMFVRIGLVGHPNVGKSSLLNCIRGTKVTSVSATPGHTKHLQTIPISSERVVLIDSPGLAFPVFGMPRALQAVIGTHQIAQTRDPQSGVGLLALHLPLERLYGLRKVDGSDGSNGSTMWSPYELCESYAKKKGYFVKHGKGALDVHRGSIEILREAYEGRLVLFFAPPDPMWLQSAVFREEVLPYLHMRVPLPDDMSDGNDQVN